MKAENKALLKGKMSKRIVYKKLAALLDGEGKRQLFDIIKSGAICELKEQEALDDGAQTMTIKFYFDPKQSQQ